MQSWSFLSRSKLASCAVVLLGSFLSQASFPSRASAQTSNPADDAVAYQINAAHSGSTSLQNFNTPLRRRWSTNLGRTVSYPLIADGRVFVTVGDSNSRWDAGAGSTSEKWLYALDANNGHLLWRKPIAGYYWRVNACYEAGRVFVSDDNGVLTAYDAATGNTAWSQKVSYWGLNPPTALNGIIYVDGYNSPGAVFSAVRASDGVILWRAYPGGGNCVMSAVTPEGVYASFGNYGTFKWDPITGAQRWRYNSGNWGTTAVFHSGLMFARGVDPVTNRGVALSAQGALVRNFDASPAPHSPETWATSRLVASSAMQVVQTGAVLWRLRPAGAK
jgi:outer membrane protein assembly factor BamB